jgi:serine/threonine protein kinase
MIRSLKKRISSKYEIIKVIGKGSYGCVSKAKCRQTGKFVAIKVMKN